VPDNKSIIIFFSNEIILEHIETITKATGFIKSLN